MSPSQYWNLHSLKVWRSCTRCYSLCKLICAFHCETLFSWSHPSTFLSSDCLLFCIAPQALRGGVWWRHLILIKWHIILLIDWYLAQSTSERLFLAIDGGISTEIDNWSCVQRVTNRLLVSRNLTSMLDCLTIKLQQSTYVFLLHPEISSASPRLAFVYTASGYRTQVLLLVHTCSLTKCLLTEPSHKLLLTREVKIIVCMSWLGCA